MTRTADEILSYGADGTLRPMVTDSSALVAILRDEPDAEALAGAIARDPRRMVSAFSLLEAPVVLAQ
jgi:uncharacterized protein with PIN domain